MDNTIRLTEIRHTSPRVRRNKQFGVRAAKTALAFHETIPEYRQTPLYHLRTLAGKLGVEDIMIKDESSRFGLNAFKVLGGSYGAACALASRAGIDISKLSFADLAAPRRRIRIERTTFVTASDGNHGRSVAWTARAFRMNCKVFLPAGTAAARVEAIRSLGADVEVTNMDYDATVQLAAETAERNGWLLIQDTSWPGYEETPAKIMQGYTTLCLEAAMQTDVQAPTHTFLQAGVGSFAAAAAAFSLDCYGEEAPKITIVEPTGAACIYPTALAAGDSLCSAQPPLKTMMAGLSCGTPSRIAWDILKNTADYAAVIPDAAAARAMRVLGNPLRGDPRIVSGESGCAGFAFVLAVLTDPSLASMKEKLGLNQNSRIFCVSTEGDTDPENYRRVVWGGLYPDLERP